MHQPPQRNPHPSIDILDEMVTGHPSDRITCIHSKKDNPEINSVVRAVETLPGGVQSDVSMLNPYPREEHTGGAASYMGSEKKG